MISMTFTDNEPRPGRRVEGGNVRIDRFHPLAPRMPSPERRETASGDSADSPRRTEAHLSAQDDEAGAAC